MLDKTPEQILDNTYLPYLAFEKFKTYKLRNAEVAWVNEKLIKSYGVEGSLDELKQHMLNEYAFVSSGYTTDRKLNAKRKKYFFADRYGSRHEVCHGGSGRCGFDGKFQVKGIGITPLLAQNMSQSHKHGKMFIDEAILEAIWGEVCHKHLPLGGVRTLAIIKTNVEEPFVYLGGSPSTPCALAVREFAVRPAHFERCTFFWPSRKYLHLRDNDADRVTECTNYFVNAVALKQSELEGNSVLYVALKKLVSVIALQMACSRIKGIPHGSLTSSNISIDGRFLDFGTITAVPDFGHYRLAQGVGAVWDDHQLVKEWLRNLASTLSHYSSYGEKLSTKDIDNLLEYFYIELDRQENISLLNELRVNRIDNKTLVVAGKIKNKLLRKPRESIHEFKNIDFITEVVHLAKFEGLEIGNVNFLLRNRKYSSFDILSKERGLKGDYSNDSISSLINSYV